MIKKTMILIFFTTILISCKKETIKEIVYKDKEYSWKRDLRFSGDDAILLNSFASTDKLNISAIGLWITIDTADNYEGILNFDYYLNYSIKRKIPITEQIFAYYWDEQKEITINSTGYQTAQYLPHFCLPKLDTAFLKINDYYIGRKSEFIAINDNMYCLIPYLTKSYLPGFFIIKPNSHLLNGIIHIDFNTDNATVRKIKLSTDEYKNSVYFMTSYYNSFFVNLEREFYRIDTLGNSQNVLHQSIYQMIQISDSLIAFGIDDQTYLSTDHGESWKNFLKIPKKDFTESNACYHNFEVINKKIIAFPICDVGKLYQLSIKDDKFQVDTIPSDGLERQDITSISEFNGKVYVTTLSGLFYKELDKFMENKD